MKTEKTEQQHITNRYVNEIIEYVLRTSHKDFASKQNSVIVLILCMTGARLSEIANLSISSVLHTTLQPNPTIKLKSQKTSNHSDSSRYISISDQIAQTLLEFIKHDRLRVVKKTCGLKKDAGQLFISAKTGLKLDAKSISQKIKLLNNLSGIKDNITAGAFRHHYHSNYYWPK